MFARPPQEPSPVRRFRFDLLSAVLLLLGAIAQPAVAGTIVPSSELSGPFFDGSEFGGAKVVPLHHMTVFGPDPPVVVGGGWQEFNWSLDSGPFNIEGAFSFDSPTPVVLTVADAFVDGDQFRVFDNGTPIGLTSTPSADGADVGAFPDLAVADSRWSSGTFLLGAGATRSRWKRYPPLPLSKSTPDSCGRMRSFPCRRR